VQQRKDKLPNVEQVVERAAWHVLCHQARVWQFEAGADKAYKAFVPEVSERFNFPGEVLNHSLRHHAIIPIQLLDGHFSALVVAAVNLAELPGAQVLDKL